MIAGYRLRGPTLKRHTGIAFRQEVAIRSLHGPIRLKANLKITGMQCTVDSVQRTVYSVKCEVVMFPFIRRRTFIRSVGLATADEIAPAAALQKIVCV